MNVGPLAEVIPGAELRTIRGAGDLFWISHPEERVAAAVGASIGTDSKSTGGVSGSAGVVGYFVITVRPSAKV